METATHPHLMNVYRRLPIRFERGEGLWLWDSAGNRYLDALSGIAVSGLGHAHPAVTQAIQKQAAALIHSSNVYRIPHQETLATELARLSGLDQAFFCNSGAEAVEAALKLARLYGHHKGIEFPHIVVMKGAFHGRTFATLAAGDSQKAQAGFEPLMPGFIRAPFNDIAALETIARNHNNIAAILLEPIQGESGIRIPDPEYLSKVQTLCQKQAWLMMLDEIQTGMGRTGQLFAYQAYPNVLPDVLILAKGLANGVPIGCCLAKDATAKLFKPGNHGSTFGGNPLATAAGLATLNFIETQKLWENAAQKGHRLLKGLKEKLQGHPAVIDIRGQGLMIGIELDRFCREILLLALEKRLLFTANEKIMRLLPPLIIQDAQIDQILEIVPELIKKFTS
jgi:acetylornithine/N-succinyldiaminopimelate aminotransferase